MFALFGFMKASIENGAQIAVFTANYIVFKAWPCYVKEKGFNYAY